MNNELNILELELGKTYREITHNATSDNRYKINEEEQLTVATVLGSEFAFMEMSRFWAKTARFVEIDTILVDWVKTFSVSVEEFMNGLVKLFADIGANAIEEANNFDKTLNNLSEAKTQWVPKIGDGYYRINDSYGGNGYRAVRDKWDNIAYDYTHLLADNCFKTREDAEAGIEDFEKRVENLLGSVEG